MFGPVLEVFTPQHSDGSQRGVIDVRFSPKPHSYMFKPSSAAFVWVSQTVIKQLCSHERLPAPHAPVWGEKNLHITKRRKELPNTLCVTL